ncbi:MAG: DUF4302 domain-containing protein [Bacteroides sp.]|nr:DUF4302 domain-containing protein [Bacteroides sp.]
MKINKIYVMLLGLILCVPLLQSCLKDDEEIFDTNASARLQQAMSEAKAVLVSSEEGWVFEMYPESSQSYGGYVFTVRFDDEYVYARTELAGDNTSEISSYYKMTDDNGPVLSFDTYNTYLHYFSTPSSSAYEAYEGEFEFVVVSATEDLVTLRGKKTGNTMYLRKLTESAESYLDKVTAMDADMIFSGFEGTIAGQTATVTLDSDYRQISFADAEGETTSVAYTVTDTGIRFYEPIEFLGQSMSSLVVDTENYKLLSDEGVEMDLTAVFPDGWRAYADYAGEYTLSYMNGEASVDVTLTPAVNNSTYLMSGLNDNYDITLTYVKSSGSLQWLSQAIGTSGSTTIWLCAWSYNSYLTWSTSVGLVTVWNGDEENPVYTFEDNGVWGSYVVDSFYLYQETSGSYTSCYDTAWYPDGRRYLGYVVSLTKK